MDGTGQFPDHVVVPDEQRARQAAASLGGHLFQAVRAVSEWMQLAPDAKLLIEVAEDYAALARHSLAMTQTKHEFSGPVTLRSDGARKSLAGLVAFQEANPELLVTLAYLTTAQPGYEVASNIPGGVSGIQYWREVVRGADIEPLRQLLLDSQYDERVLNMLREADAETLRSRLIVPVTWLTGSPALPEAKAALLARLRSLGVDRTGYADDGERAFPFLIYRVLRTAVSAERVLTRDDFEEEWAKATTLSVSVTMMRRMGSMLADGESAVPMTTAPPLPALSPRLAPRGSLINELRDVVRSTDVLWIHGSSGVGKSQLTRLMAARENGRWEFVPLKGCDESERANRMRTAITKITRDDFAGLILDDVPVPASEELRHWIAAAALETGAHPGARIVVTSEREPLPQVRQAFDPLRIFVQEAPYLTEEDVRDVVIATGGDADLWAGPIYLTCGKGHPLLVDARIAGLASKGWPAKERLKGLGIEDGPSEVREVRREVSLRLLGELSSDAHLLLLRLSALIGPFDRRLVDAIAKIEPPIPRAGALFELLVGPWIELQGTDRYSLSPLLVSAAGNLSEEERNNIHRTVVDTLVRRNPFPGDLLSALVLHSIFVRHLGGFMFITKAIMTVANRATIASALVPVLFMKSDTDGILVPEQRGISVMMRIAQVLVALDAAPQMLEQILETALAESDTLPEPLRAANTYTMLMAVLGSETADLPPATWLPLLLRYRQLSTGGGVPAEMLKVVDPSDYGGLSPDQLFFVLRSNKVDAVADLDALFGQLEDLEPKWRHELLKAPPMLMKGPPLFVQKAWSTEALAGTLDAEAAVTSYARLTENAIAWGEDEIAIECIRSRVVILDEYLDQHEDALALLDDADARFGRNERLLRSRATVFATMGRHEEELAILTALGPDYSAEEPLERLMMLRSSAISAGKLAHFEDAAALFHQAFEMAHNEDPLVLGKSVSPGLLADAAVMEIRGNRPAEALSSLVRALEFIDNNASSSDASLQFARGAVEHVCQWGSSLLEGRRAPRDLSIAPGICSTLRPTFDPEDAPPRVPNQGWYLLTRLEAVAGIDAGVEARLEAREKNDGVQTRLAMGVTALQVEAASARCDSEAVFRLLPRHAWLSGLLIKSQSDPSLAERSQSVEHQITPDKWDQVEILAARAAVAGLLGMLIVDRPTRDAVAAADRARNISPSLGMLMPELDPEVSGDWDVFATGIAAARRLMDVEQLNAEQLLCVSVNLFVWLKHTGVSRLDARLYTILAQRWLKLTELRRATLSNPRLAVPAILAATELPPSIAAIARLTQAACLGCSITLPSQVVEMLRRT